MSNTLSGSTLASTNNENVQSFADFQSVKNVTFAIIRA